MSFLTQGKWNNPALVLGFDPREVVRRAVLNGTLPAPKPAAPPAVKRGRGQPPKNHSATERTAALRAASERYYARRVGESVPLRTVRRPELAGLTGRAYHRAYAALYRAGLLKPAAQLETK